jgi:hypothetical protein
MEAGTMIEFRIPDEAIEQLRDLLEEDKKLQWEVGDFIVAYWAEIQKYIPEKEHRKMHAKLIRDFANGTGASRTTLRDREKMSMFFTVLERERYEVFTFHQFRALRSAGEDWQEWAEWALINGFNGAPASHRAIREAIKGERDPYLALIEDLDSIAKKVRKIMDAEETPKSVRTGLSCIPTIIEDVKGTL